MTDGELRAILEDVSVIAAVGLSSKPERPSHGVSMYLKNHGYRVIPVNPNESEVIGETAYPDLASVPEDIDVVLVFRRPEHVLPVAEAAIAKGARVFWMQDGAGNEDAAEAVRGAGMTAVVNDCMMRQHRRLIGG